MEPLSRYRSLTPREHVLARTPVYAGNSVSQEQDRAVYADGAVTTHPVLTNDALQKLFDEALDNAVDNAYRDPPTTEVRVRMDDTSFECANNGAHIPVQQLPDGQQVASTIFFKMFAGSNFDDDAGREAAGASAKSHSPPSASHDATPQSNPRRPASPAARRRRNRRTRR